MYFLILLEYCASENMISCNNTLICATLCDGKRECISPNDEENCGMLFLLTLIVMADIAENNFVVSFTLGKKRMKTRKKIKNIVQFSKVES